MSNLFHSLFLETWWSWNRPPGEPHTILDIACRGFNVVEAVAWFAFAFLTLRRWRSNRKSGIELWYAGAFVLFGLSDVIETYALTSWLLWWKTLNLIALFLLRRTVMRTCYPDARIF